MIVRTVQVRIWLVVVIVAITLACNLPYQNPEADLDRQEKEAGIGDPVEEMPAVELESTAPAPPPSLAEGEAIGQVPEQDDNPSPPDEMVKLIFIHHSVGENWLADTDGALGLALMENNYFVSDTNYGWGPQGIGDRTDIPDWLEWFRSTDSELYLDALFRANENFSGVYTRAQDPEPMRENQVVLFKSCFPNSNLTGSPNDLPADSEAYSVSHAKYVYQEILEYFATRQDKLFVVITAPPVTAGDSDASPTNARAFNNWLVDEWLANYPYNNVAVFDLFNVLTSNGANAATHDLGAENGNHHRWWDGSIQHTQSEYNDYAAYPTGDSHPSQAGNRKATAEFVPLLNVYYQRWRDDEKAAAMPSHPLATPTLMAAIDSEQGSAPLSLIQPEDLSYLGAFRLPDDQSFEIGWAWSGEALAFRSDGDRDGPADGFPGSLFGTGHNWNQYVSEIDIPLPVISQEKDLSPLNTAATLQPFQNIRGDLYNHLDFEVPRAGLQYLPAADGPLAGTLHFCWGQHYQEEGPQPSHGFSSPDLSNPQSNGAWTIGDFNIYSTNDYLFDIPEAWTSAYAPGMSLATGRFRDGGWGGQGPSLIAYAPGDPDNPPHSGSRLPAIPLILYASTRDDESLDRRLAMNEYHLSDEWSGGVWLETSERSAVVFAGTKGTGDSWYCFANGVVWPDEPPYPEIPDPPNDDRGWWSTTFEGQLIFYDPNDLAAVALGDFAPYEPQPYAMLNIDPFLFNIRSDQQKHHIGAIAYDSDNGFLYILEPLVDEEKPIVHVFELL